MGDGWISNLGGPDERSRGTIDRLRDYARQEGREPGSIGIETWLTVRGDAPERWAMEAASWVDIGVTHISVNTMKAGFTSPQEHIDAIRRFKETVDL